MEDEKKDPPKVEWQYRKEFGINTQMQEVVHKTIELAQSEIARYRKKLSRLTYGA